MASSASMPAPSRVQSRRKVAPPESLQHITEYLEAAQNGAQLHPDNVVTADGILFSSQGSSGGVAFHTLRRLQAGLRGEFVAADSAADGGEDASDQGSVDKVPTPEQDTSATDDKMSSSRSPNSEDATSEQEMGDAVHTEVQTPATAIPAQAGTTKRDSTKIHKSGGSKGEDESA